MFDVNSSVWVVPEEAPGVEDEGADGPDHKVHPEGGATEQTH